MAASDWQSRTTHLALLICLDTSQAAATLVAGDGVAAVTAEAVAAAAAVVGVVVAVVGALAAACRKKVAVARSSSGPARHGVHR